MDLQDLEDLLKRGEIVYVAPEIKKAVPKGKEPKTEYKAEDITFIEIDLTDDTINEDDI